MFRFTACLAHIFLLTAEYGQAMLMPESELTDNCFDFPARNFDESNCIVGIHGDSPYFPLLPGHNAIDFTLHDIDGQPWNLKDALEKGRPVVMIWGMFTCPAYQGMGTSPPWDKCSYWHEYDLVETYKTRATFVHLYGPEPHPTLPGTNFDKGQSVPNYWSVVSQQRNYQDRLEMAHRVRDMVHPDQVLLPDYLVGNPYSSLNQPVWCSYALGARTAVIVSTKGRIAFQQEWLQTDDLAAAIDRYWASL